MFVNVLRDFVTWKAQKSVTTNELAIKHVFCRFLFEEKFLENTQKSDFDNLVFLIVHVMEYYINQNISWPQR